MARSDEPEIIPGRVFRMLNPRVTLLIFVSGKVVLTGAKTRADMFRAFEAIYPVSAGLSSFSPALLRGATRLIKPLVPVRHRSSWNTGRAGCSVGGCIIYICLLSARPASITHAYHCRAVTCHFKKKKKKEENILSTTTTELTASR